MIGEDNAGGSESHPPLKLREVPVAWEALEDAFENNAPEIHSYLHLGTGEVARVVDGLADPGTHIRIAADSSYLRVEPVSSREQYRWMERFIATMEEGPFRAKLQQAIDGKGAFRRFKDVLMAFPADRERWFQFRSERLRACMEGWLEAQGVVAVQRPDWQVPRVEDLPPLGEAQERAPVVPKRNVRTMPSAEILRRYLHELVELLSVRELDSAVAFLEFLRDRRHGLRAGTREGGYSDPSDDGGPRMG